MPETSCHWSHESWAIFPHLGAHSYSSCPRGGWVKVCLLCLAQGDPWLSRTAGRPGTRVTLMGLWGPGPCSGMMAEMRLWERPLGVGVRGLV